MNGTKIKLLTVLSIATFFGGMFVNGCGTSVGDNENEAKTQSTNSMYRLNTSTNESSNDVDESTNEIEESENDTDGNTVKKPGFSDIDPTLPQRAPFPEHH